MEIEAIVFDVDGVLLDSFDSWFISFNQTLVEFGKDPVDRQTYKKIFWGPSVEEDLRRYNLGMDAVEAALRNQRNNVHLMKLHDRVHETLDALKGYKLGVATNTPRINLDKTFNYFNLYKYFEVVMCLDDVEKPKPHPDMLLKASEILKVPVEKMLFVGDTKSDMAAAKSAGCHFIGIKIGDKKVDGIKDLIPILYS
ncbi:MAG: 2-deoxyglucose-6-phosphatase [Candidatus Methanofastidiosum methylothiophilum]|uniref:2-deoxyglucose-6-phosphatase n=1 Tax=Candidatus Methanofastidiosum methylothiophilum TaxID=1705564 RepID=A0A150IRP7_9EURY|nr:MAG: 2-deoxyglucose-6-phosphatase [Candidatus Methanofastidiosum methylthiophilus]KYC47548.1 MAG: 2-deoxyglucose-6-phosphatase [Candidatus Methanofastidiosum methylthiophilus]KYC50184.1 MAG: 2-deoxyglucose-6-phosphatase [Candidatus Methanofastidiosum methylthiophilus]